MCWAVLGREAAPEGLSGTACVSQGFWSGERTGIKAALDDLPSGVSLSSMEGNSLISSY